MAITLNGTTGITTPDVNVTAQSSNIVTTGNITAVDATLSGGVYVGGTAAANYLDDYEEGTYSPTFYSAGTTPTGITYTYQRGRYVKVGGVVTVHLMLGGTWTNSPTGIFYMTLPFASFAPSPNSTYGCLVIGYMAGVTLPASRTFASGEIPNGASATSILGNGSGIGGSSCQIVTNVASGFAVEASVTYFVA